MNLTPASTQQLLVFGLVLLCVVVMVLSAIYYSNLRLLGDPKKETIKSFAFIGVWLGIITVLSLTGAINQLPQLLYPLVMFFSFVIPIWFALSDKGAKIALSVPLAFLVGFHVFRLPINLMLDVWVEDGILPKAYTWIGINYDVVTGMLALIFAPLANRYRWIAWGINIVGIVLFFHVLGIDSVLGITQISKGMDSPFVYQWPFILANPIGIGGVVAGHIILTRALRYH
ncbi:hypothetical protein [Bdellovibrio sp. NC01]|uniref:hypothetical protein n=1 Tax=Bdellovibrio sp. NC01 TaxID=2220073 RepID=UPI00115BAF72|nr:hypothetical protein [Bdellovibrio sp. NC01]QDK36346.1 hypothetical protein DOE51_01385 [Bdellovibrio sp. NC01]